MTIKADVLETVKGLPNNSTLKDIQYHLYVMGKINKGRDEIKKGKLIPHAKAVEILGKKWNIK